MKISAVFCALLASSAAAFAPSTSEVCLNKWRQRLVANVAFQNGSAFSTTMHLFLTTKFLLPSFPCLALNGFSALALP